MCRLCVWSARPAHVWASNSDCARWVEKRPHFCFPAGSARRQNRRPRVVCAFQQGGDSISVTIVTRTELVTAWRLLTVGGCHRLPGGLSTFWEVCHQFRVALIDNESAKRSCLLLEVLTWRWSSYHWWTPCDTPERERQHSIWRPSGQQSQWWQRSRDGWSWVEGASRQPQESVLARCESTDEKTKNFLSKMIRFLSISSSAFLVERIEFHSWHSLSNYVCWICLLTMIIQTTWACTCNLILYFAQIHQYTSDSLWLQNNFYQTRFYGPWNWWTMKLCLNLFFLFRSTSLFFARVDMRCKYNVG
jgi:hypothetical protein